MMSQKSMLGVNEQVIAQAELEKDIKKQADLIAPEKDLTSSQIQSFLSVENSNTPIPTSTNLPDEPQRQRLRNMLIGSREVVTKTIHYLHLIGYAPEGDWSPLQPNPHNQAEVISILVRHIRV